MVLVTMATEVVNIILMLDNVIPYEYQSTEKIL